EQRFPEIAPEPVIQEIGGPLPPRGNRRLAEHDGNQLAPVARGADHDIETGFADEAGLHAVGSRVADSMPLWERMTLLPTWTWIVWNRPAYSGNSTMMARVSLARSRAVVTCSSLGRPFTLA